jgi:hypothetical protein
LESAQAQVKVTASMLKSYLKLLGSKLQPRDLGTEMPQACSKWVAIIIATITTAMAIEAAVA